MNEENLCKEKVTYEYYCTFDPYKIIEGVDNTYCKYYKAEMEYGGSYGCQWRFHYNFIIVVLRLEKKLVR